MAIEQVKIFLGKTRQHIEHELHGQKPHPLEGGWACELLIALDQAVASLNLTRLSQGRQLPPGYVNSEDIGTMGCARQPDVLRSRVKQV